MKRIRLDRIKGSALLLLAGTVLLLGIGGSVARETLCYDRDAIFSGQVWRLFTAPLVHLGWPHLLLNLAGLLLIWGLFAQNFNSRRWLYLYLGCATSVGSILLINNPEIGWYLGLSGVLHGLFSAGAIAERVTLPRITFIMLGALTAKLAWEQIRGSVPSTTALAGGAVIVDAHLYGAIAGLVLGWVLSTSPKKTMAKS